MSSFTANYARWIVKHPLWVICFTLIVVFVCVIGAVNLRITSSYRVYFSPENKKLQELEAIEAEFAKNDSVLIVAAADGGDVLTVPILRAIKAVTEQAWQAPFSTRVDSITNFQHARNEAGDLVVEDLVSDPDSLDTDAIADIRRIALDEPALAGRLINADASVTAINVTFSRPGVDEYGENLQIATFVRELAEQLEVEALGLKSYVTGPVMVDWAFTEATIGDMQRVVPWAVVLMVVSLYVMLRSPAGTIMTIAVVLFSIISGMGFGFHLGYPLSPATAAAPVVMCTIGIADCMHVLHAYWHERDQGMSVDDALIRALDINLLPMFFTAFNTAVGFLAFNFSDVPPFRHLGNIVGFGVIMVWILAISYLPALIKLSALRSPARTSGRARLLGGLAELVIRFRWVSVVFWLFGSVAMCWLASKNELNDVFVHYFDKTFEFRRDTDFTAENLTGVYTIEYALHSGEPDKANNPEFLREVEAFAAWYREQAETMHVNAITDVIKRINRSYHDDDEAYYRIPDTQEETAQLMLTYEFSLPFGLDLSTQVDLEKEATRMTVTIETLDTSEILALEHRAEAWLQRNTKIITATQATGASPIFADVSSKNIVSMLFGTLVSFIIISDCLMLFFRSVWLGILSLIPNITPAIFGFGIWALLDGQIGLSLSVVTSFTLGIVVDDTIHFVATFLRGQREHGYTAEDAIRYTFKTIGYAASSTSIVLILGFGVLGISHFYLNASMGISTVIIFAVALLADLTLTPAVLVIFSRKRPEASQFYNPRPYVKP